jgi:hypothetical protein
MNKFLNIETNIVTIKGYVYKKVKMIAQVIAGLYDVQGYTLLYYISILYYIAKL